MKAHIQQLDSTWNIKQPYSTWVEPRTGFVGRGHAIPDDSIKIERHLGEASVSIEATFGITGDPTGKEKEFVQKLMELLEEFEV